MDVLGKKALELLSTLKQTGSYSDLDITCGDRIFQVHSAIVCPQSEFFARAVSGSFQEGLTRTVELHDDDPEDVARMVDFFYYMDYTYSCPDVKEASIFSTVTSCLLNSTAMYTIADKYLVPTLKDTARAKFEASIIAQCSKSVLMSHLWISKHLRKLVRAVYTSTPPSDRGLRDVIHDVIFQDRKVPWKKKTFTAVEEAMKIIPEAHFDFLKRRVSYLEAALAAGHKEIAELRSKVCDPQK